MERDGRSALGFGLLALRALVGLLFVASGFSKFADDARTVADFAQWNVPLADSMASVVGGLEVVAGALLVLGVATRLVALPLGVLMIGAVLTAGVAEGGQHLVLPPVLTLLCALFAVRGGGAWQLLASPSIPLAASNATRG